MKPQTALIVAVVILAAALGAFLGWKAFALLGVGGAGVVAATTRRRAKEAVVVAVNQERDTQAKADAIKEDARAAAEHASSSGEEAANARLVGWDSDHSARRRPRGGD